MKIFAMLSLALAGLWSCQMTQPISPSHLKDQGIRQPGRPFLTMQARGNCFLPEHMAAAALRINDSAGHLTILDKGMGEQAKLMTVEELAAETTPRAVALALPSSYTGEGRCHMSMYHPSLAAWQRCQAEGCQDPDVFALQTVKIDQNAPAVFLDAFPQGGLSRHQHAYEQFKGKDLAAFLRQNTHYVYNPAGPYRRYDQGRLLDSVEVVFQDAQEVLPAVPQAPTLKVYLSSGNGSYTVVDSEGAVIRQGAVTSEQMVTDLGDRPGSYTVSFDLDVCYTTYFVTVNPDRSVTLEYALSSTKYPQD